MTTLLAFIPALMIACLSESAGVSAAGMVDSMRMLAWRPFLDPLAVHGWWYLFLFPLVIGISVTYKAIRLPSLDRIWWQTGKMTIQVVAALLAMSVLLFILVQWIIPLA